MNQPPQSQAKFADKVGPALSSSATTLLEAKLRAAEEDRDRLKALLATAQRETVEAVATAFFVLVTNQIVTKEQAEAMWLARLTRLGR